MKQDERWNLRYQEVMDFITANHRNPSRHRIEEHDMLNWLKANRKVMNKGEIRRLKATDGSRFMIQGSWLRVKGGEWLRVVNG